MADPAARIIRASLMGHHQVRVADLYDEVLLGRPTAGNPVLLLRVVLSTLLNVPPDGIEVIG